MIKACNDNELIERNIDEKYILLFQVWKELTEPKTLDSYQYRVMNTLSGIRELSLVINQRLNAFTNTNHYITDCKVELRNIISNDETLRIHYPIIWRRLLSHLSDKTEFDYQQKALIYQLDYCFKEIQSNYFKYLFEDLEDSIQNAMHEEIIKKAGQLISCCITRGWSAQALNGLINKLYNSKNNVTQWNDFKNTILSAETHLYKVYIPITVNTKPFKSYTKSFLRDRFKNELIDMGVDVISPETMMDIKESNSISNLKIENRGYMLFEVYALDIYAASHNAISKCSDVMSLLSFFNFVEAWEASELTCLVSNTEFSYYKLINYRDLYSTYDYLEGAHKLYTSAKKIVSIDSSIQRKLRDAFSYSNMGKASSAQEQKFINTWVALESLCRGDVYDNIISNILETVPPALCSRYIYQLFRNFIEDCNRCEVKLVFDSIPLYDSKTSKEECVKRIIAVFTNENKYLELKNMCCVNSLLVCRCESLKIIATDHNAFINKIEQHYNNVKLQLSRLYRIRNEIAHDAHSTDGSLVILIEHLDDYLAGVVAELIMCSQKKNIFEIETIFEIIKDNYRGFKDIVNAKKATGNMTLLDSLYETGIIDLI